MRGGRWGFPPAMFVAHSLTMIDDRPETDWSLENVGGLADLVQILATNPDVLVRRGPLRTQGRMTFGYEYAGADGIGLYILLEDDDADE